MMQYFCKGTFSFPIQMGISLTQIKFLNTTIINNTDCFLHPKHFQTNIRNWFFLMSVSSLPLIIDEIAMDVNGGSLETSFKIFRTFTLFVRSFVPTYIMRSSDCFSLFLSGKFTVFTLWLGTKTFFRDTIYQNISGHYYFLHIIQRFYLFCLIFLFLYQIRSGLCFLNFCCFNSFSDSFFSCAELISGSFFCFRRKLTTAPFSVRSLSRLDIRFIKSSKSNGEFTL